MLSRVVFLVAVAGATSAVLAQPPSFILFFPDQLRSQEIGCYGNTVAQTPNMDSLATSGVRFNYAMPGLPVCTPCRASLQTGRMPFAVRSSSAGQQWMVVNSVTLHTNEITIAEQLNGLGYSCAYFEKWHLQEGGTCVADRQGYTFFEGLNAYGDYDDPKYCDNNGVLRTEPGRWLPDVMTDRALNFITSNKDNPFFAYVSLGPPHAPGGYSWGQYHDPLTISFDGRMELWDMFASVSIPLRPNVPETLADYAVRQLREYDGMVAGIDQCLGRIRSKLVELGIDNRTIIIVSADHGGQMGSHATAFNTTIGWEKNEIYDESILVPLIIYDPRHPPEPGGQVRNELVSLMDFLPTIVELAGGTPNPRVQGRSFAPVITGSGTYQPRDAVMVQFNSTNFLGVGYGRSRALRTSQWKFGLFEVGSGSGNLQDKALFDLQADPYELTNLVNDPDHATIRSQLHARLMEEMEAVLDPLVVTPPPEIKLNRSSMEVSVGRGGSPHNGAFTVTNVYFGTLDYTISDDASWLTTVPSGGTCVSDETDTITIQYQTAGLAAGNYSATIHVADANAVNSPQQIAVRLQVYTPGDFDEDGDVDQSDFAHFQACLTGPGMAYPAECERADLDLDGNVDQADFALFANCMGGANQPPGC